MKLDNTALIIPAFNEATRISAVIEPALASPLLSNIIVVNDGSSDNTAEVALTYPVECIRHSENLGKGEAMQSGVDAAKKLGATSLMFLDADLHGLLPKHIEGLASPVRSGEAIMTIGILERPLLHRYILRRWGALSGQRTLTVELWDQLEEWQRSGFRVEASLNATARHHNQHHMIERIELRHVTHTGKREKEPTLAKAAHAYAKIYGAAIGAYAQAEPTYSRLPFKQR